MKELLLEIQKTSQGDLSSQAKFWNPESMEKIATAPKAMLRR